VLEFTVPKRNVVIYNKYIFISLFMEYTKKTKIVCTIGPSSWDQEVMRQMIEAGMTCARVNGAFADEAELDKVTALVRNVSNEVALMMDVKGPEVRMNKFAEPKKLNPGMEVVIGNDESAEIYPANYKDLYKHLNPGQRIVIGDGDTELIIKSIEGDKMITEVVFGELLKPGKAMNLPGADFATSALTDKDIRNLKHSLELGWDFVSASFIQTADAAREVKKYLEGSNMKLIAKIEDGSGVENIDEILEVVDGIMVARGGLGVELGLENVPMAQLELIEKSIAIGKPVITATQMLESMITNPRPTRAEAADVSNAVYDETDCIMLSNETAAGKYPVKAVEIMRKIATYNEHHKGCNSFKPHLTSQSHLIVNAALSVVEGDGSQSGCKVDKMVVLTETGSTARILSSFRPKIPVIAISESEKTVTELSINYGVVGVKLNIEKADLIYPTNLIKQLEEQQLVTSGETLLIVHGHKYKEPGSTNAMVIVKVS
jgi:pyruvate kinase